MKSNSPSVNKPKNWSILQQTMTNLKPKSSPLILSVIYFIFFLGFLILAIAAFLAYADMFEAVIEYEASNETIEKNFTVTDTISSPVYLYYRLSRFFINHRRFLTSRDEDQLAGESISDSALDTCDPRIDDGQKVNSTDPCGLAAAAFFNDTFTLYYDNRTVDGMTLGINPQYEKKLYKCPDGDCSVPSINPTDPHFITWMRPQPFSSFSKKYLVFEDGLIPGLYIVRINENVNGTENFTVHSYEPSSHGKKYVVFATSSWLGKRTLFPAILLLIMSAICLVSTFFFLYTNKWDQRMREDYLKRHNMRVVGRLKS